LVEQGPNRWTVKIEDYLRYAGIESFNQISEIETSTYFPPGKYSNTGRTAQMSSTYQCIGSGSLLFRLENGDERAISLALFHDRLPLHDNRELSRRAGDNKLLASQLLLPLWICLLLAVEANPLLCHSGNVEMAKPAQMTRHSHSTLEDWK